MRISDWSSDVCSSDRLAATLAALAEGLGARETAVAREITKLYEECVTGSLAELAARYAEAAPKGEIVIVVAPPAEAGAEERSEEQPSEPQSLMRNSNDVFWFQKKTYNKITHYCRSN